ncbi:Rmf/CrpP fold protein [Streptomyces sp. NPDC054863]
MQGGGRLGFREDALRARQAGFAAALTGRPATVCPYRGVEPLLRTAWVRGYVAARPPTPFK